MIRFLTAGESHGPGLTVILEGCPAGLTLSAESLNTQLARRQVGYGRGGRMILEKDRVQFRSGVRFNTTTAAPITLWIENRDWANWETVMAAEGKRTEAADEKAFMRPRPGHADLAAFYKYGFTDLRDALERASARETTARVAAGAIARALLAELGITLHSHVTQLGGVMVERAALPQTFDALVAATEANDMRCAGDETSLAAMRGRVDEARMAGVTLGGDIEVVVVGLPPGLGSYVHWDRRLDGQLAQALMSIQAVKAVSVGDGDQGGAVTGDHFHDPIHMTETVADAETMLWRSSNHAGGLEAGVTNGMPLVLKAVMKPIATMRTALPSVNLETQAEEAAHFERSDVTAVAACGVVCEAMVALVLANAVLEKFGGDHLGDIQAALAHYRQRLVLAPQAVG